MPWLRLTIAALTTVLVVVGVGWVSWAAGQGASGQQWLSSAPGLSAPDAAALALPFEELMGNRDEALVARVAEGIDENQVRAQLQQLRALLPPEPFQSSRLIGWRTGSLEGGQYLVGEHEYAFPRHVARTETTLVRSAAQSWRVYGFQMNVATNDELAANRFTLHGKSPLFVSIIIATALMPFVSLGSFLAALFWKGLKRRWAWSVATLIGIGAFSLNGATGAWAFNPLFFQVFAAGATWSGSAFDAWIFSVSLPLGALAFWTIGTRRPKPTADELIATVREEAAATPQSGGQITNREDDG